MLEIKCPITGKRIAVAENDFENKMYFNQAVNSCNNLGIGWRLPKQYELDLIYNQLHKLGKGNFKKASYWTSSECNNYDAWYVSFHNGTPFHGSKNDKFYVRAVIDL